jgi:hypothetical protein
MSLESLLYYGIGLVLLFGLLSRISKPLERWQRWRSFTRSYKRLPPHQNVGELADRLERLGDCFLDRSIAGNLLDPRRDKSTWEWQLGMDLKELVDQVRSHIPHDNYTSGWWVERQRNGMEKKKAP